MPTIVPEKKVKNYREQSRQIEEKIKTWASEIRLMDLNDQSEKCYKAFTNLQMSLASMTDEHERDKHQKECFKITEGLISFFDCNVETQDLNYIYTSSITKGFAHLWDYLHKYCNNMTARYDWAQKY